MKVGVMWGDALVRVCAAEPVLSCGQLRGHAVCGRRLTTRRHATHCNTTQSSSRRGSICETVKWEEKRTYGSLMKESLTKAKICTGRTTHILHSALCYNKLAFPLAVTLHSDGFVTNWLNYSFIWNLLLDREKL